jgi:hypothetical protein
MARGLGEVSDASDLCGMPLGQMSIQPRGSALLSRLNHCNQICSQAGEVNVLASWGVQERVRWASSSVLGRRWRRTPCVLDEQDCSLSEGIRIRFRAQNPEIIPKHFYRKNRNRDSFVCCFLRRTFRFPLCSLPLVLRHRFAFACGPRRIFQG